MPSGVTFSRLDVATPKAQVLIQVAAASHLRVAGLSAPPSAGTVNFAVPQWGRRFQWDSRVSFSLFWDAPNRQGEWDFRDGNGGLELICWTEWQHSPFLVRSNDDGDEFYEQLRITSGTGGACGSRAGFVVEHWGSHGIRAISVEDIPRIAAEWEARKRS